jgi:FkbM family methyltransferase
MKTADLVSYYLEHKDEFIAEAGHDVLLEKLKKVIKPEVSAKVVGIDVGCCIGDYISNINHLCIESNKSILCFEPNPVNIQVIEGRIVNTDIKLFKHCISNETGKTSLFNYKGYNSNNAGNGVAGLRSGGQKICSVDVKRLDNVLDAEFKEDIIIKFIKIDTEGNDSNVIKSLGRYLTKTKYIIFECSDCLDDMRGPGIENPMKDIVDFLSTNGFDTYRIGTKKLFKVNDEYWSQTYDDVKYWSNCFALKKGDNLIHEIIDNNFNYI